MRARIVYRRPLGQVFGAAAPWITAVTATLVVAACIAWVFFINAFTATCLLVVLIAIVWTVVACVSSYRKGRAS